MRELGSLRLSGEVRAQLPISLTATSGALPAPTRINPDNVHFNKSEQVAYFSGSMRGLSQNALNALEMPFSDKFIKNSSNAYVSSGLKRLVDVAASLIAIVFFGPLMALVTLMILLFDFGPILYTQERIGLHGRKFHILKFRTMCANAEKVLADVLERDETARSEWATRQKLECDPRVTWFGKFMRLSSVDELPQLFNVLVGDMSIVGPRPIVEQEASRYGRYLADYVSCRPGITGLWQVNGRNGTTYRRRVAIDTKYSRCVCFVLDLRILAKTVPTILKGDGCS